MSFGERMYLPLKKKNYYLLLLLFLSIKVNAELNISLVTDLISDKNILSELDLSSRIFLKLEKELGNEVDITYQRADRKREWLLLRKRDDVCLYNKVKTKEREQQANFTIQPISLFPSNRLILKNSNLTKLISFEEVIQSSALNIGVVQGRSYGEQLDKLIKANASKLFIMDGEFAAQRLRMMFMQNKIDGIVEYADVLHNEFPDKKLEDLVSFHTIKETNAFISGYIACSIGTKGQQAIRLFNQVITAPEFRKYMIDEHKKIFRFIDTNSLANELTSTFK